jgi:glycosyltransferase involved in cell wall biosynthesis
MAMGKPVVVSKCEGFTEVVDNGETGIVVEDLSRKSIAAAMKYIMDNPSVAGELGTKAREAAAARYNWNHNVDNMIKVYEELCGTV